MRKEISNHPSIFDFLDIVLYLNSYFEYRSHTQSDFSYTLWAKELGFSNKTLLRFILQKKRLISEKTAVALKNYLKLDSTEREYFDLLLNYSQAKSTQSRQAYGHLLTNFLRQKNALKIVEAHKAVPNAYGPVILSVLTYKDIAVTSQFLSDLFDIPLSLVTETVDLLIESGLVKKSSQGILSFEGENFQIPNADQNKALGEFHRFWLSKSIQALDLPSETRKFRSLKVALTKEEFQQALEKINDFAFTFLSKFSQNNLQERQLYMFESVIFPISQVCSQATESLSQPNTLPPHPTRIV